jgi:hypothetical protein
MNKSILLAVIGIFLMSSFATISYAETYGTYHWSWNMCNGYIDHATLQIDAGIGSSQIVVAWSVPATSNEYAYYPNCAKTTFSGVEIYMSITAAGQTSIPVTASSGAYSGVFTLTAITEICGIHGCTSQHPYAMQYGNYVTVEITPCYWYNQVCHGTTKTLKVTA